MPRVRLRPERVVAAAAELADRDGLSALTVSSLARALGVRPPSLYGHVDGLEDIRRRLAALAADELTAALTAAAGGRSGDAALRALAHAYRDWAHRHPGRYAALQPAVDPDDEGSRRMVAIVLAVLGGDGIAAKEALDRTRAVRAALHGFVALEAAGGFGLAPDPAPDPDRSFARLVEILIRGMAETAH